MVMTCHINLRWNFLEYTLRQNLTWRGLWKQYYLSKEGLNLLKSIIKSPWGQDRYNYGQEVYFSVPKSYLKKLQSLDSKSIKLALGIPVHTTTLGACGEAGILPPDEIRKLAAAKYIIRGSFVADHTNTEVELRFGQHFSKRVLKNLSQRLKNYSRVHFWIVWENTNESQESCHILQI